MDEEEKCEEGAPMWVVTFGDMMSLLLTFFILLLSFAKMEKTRFRVLSSSMKKAFGVQNVSPKYQRQDGRSVVREEFSMPFNASETTGRLKNMAIRQQTRSPQGTVDITVEENHEGVKLTIGEEGIFKSGSADIRPEFFPFMEDLAKLISENRSQIRISAFTDNVPIRSTTFASNDHLSAARAVSVIRYLRMSHSLRAERFEAVPFGPHRPIAPNISRIGRKQNRRLEIKFYKRPLAEWNRVGDEEALAPQPLDAP